MLLQNRDVGLLPNRGNKSANDFLSGSVRRMEDAAVRMASFQTEVVFGILSPRAAGKVRPQRNEFADAVRSFSDNGFNYIRMTEVGSSNQRIVDMSSERIFSAPHRGNASLSVGAVALGEPIFGDDHHRATGRGLQGQT